MLADFQADGRWLGANYRVKRAEREGHYQSESRVDRNFSSFQGQKTESGSSWVWLGRVDTRSESLGTRFGSKHRLEAFGLLMSGDSCDAVWGEGRDGRGASTRDGQNKTPPGFRGWRQVWKFNFKVGQMLFSGSPASGHMLVAMRLLSLRFWNALRLLSVRFCLPGREGKLFQSNCLTTGFSVSWVGRRGGKLKMRWGECVHQREQVSMEKFSGWVNIRGSRYRRPVLKRDGSLESLLILLTMAANLWFPVHALSFLDARHYHF